MARVNATLEGSLKAAAAPATTREEHGPSIVHVRKSAGIIFRLTISRFFKPNSIAFTHGILNYFFYNEGF